MVASTEILDRLLDPVGRLLSPEVARRLIALRADPVAQARVDYLGDRANEGLLTPEEREEYETLVAASNVIAILQAKARASLASSAA
jgi:hypothetical protein